MKKKLTNMDMNIPAPSKKTFIASVGIAAMVTILSSQPITILSLGGAAIIGVVTCYCVHIQYLIDYKKIV